MRILFLLPFLLISCANRSNLYQIKNEGGLSSLTYEGKNAAGDMVFWSNTDRGPNANEVKIKDSKIVHRPFMNPAFRPYWLKFSVNLKSGRVKILEKIDLGMSGLPNKQSDEVPVDKKGNELARDVKGIDPESMCFDGEFVWMGEEYRPSILKFNLKGKLLRRFVPQNTYSPKERVLMPEIREVLPEKLKKIKENRGFEGLACSLGNVYAVLQSPMPEDGNTILIFQFNTAREKVEKEHLYQLNLLEADKIGDLTVKGDDFFIIEQKSETGPLSYHKVFQFKLTNIDDQGYIQKKLALDLVKLKYDFAEKVEGIAILDDGKIAIINDNDFELTGEWDKKKGKAKTDPDKKSFLGIFPKP